MYIYIASAGTRKNTAGTTGGGDTGSEEENLEELANSLPQCIYVNKELKLERFREYLGEEFNCQSDKLQITLIHFGKVSFHFFFVFFFFLIFFVFWFLLCVFAWFFQFVAFFIFLFFIFLEIGNNISRRRKNIGTIKFNAWFYALCIVSSVCVCVCVCVCCVCLCMRVCVCCECEKTKNKTKTRKTENVEKKQMDHDTIQRIV